MALLSVLAIPLLVACSEDVTGPPTPELSPPLRVVPSTAAMRVGQTLELEALVRGDHGSWHVAPQAPGWQSSEPEIAEIDEDGAVRAMAEGLVVITAECNGFCAYAHIRVVAKDGSLNW
jgi:hypothetical protein